MQRGLATSKMQQSNCNATLVAAILANYCDLSAHVILLLATLRKNSASDLQDKEIAAAGRWFSVLFLPNGNHRCHRM
jgi:hypothetical protein